MNSMTIGDLKNGTELIQSYDGFIYTSLEKMQIKWLVRQIMEEHWSFPEKPEIRRLLGNPFSFIF